MQTTNNPLLSPDNEQNNRAPHNRTILYWLVGIGSVMGICLGALACIFSGVYLVSSTPALIAEFNNQLTRSAPTASPDVPAAQTRTAAEELAAGASQWPVVIDDPFDRDTNSWDTGKYISDSADVNRVIQNSKYRLEINSTDHFSWWQIPEILPVSDFYLAVDEKQVSGSKDNMFGVTFRYSQEGCYTFLIYNDGVFSLQVLSGDRWTTLIDWTKTAAIRPGETNKLIVIAQGQVITLFINDQFVGEIENDKHNQGKVGLTSLVATKDQAVFEFDNFELRAPNELPPEINGTPTGSLLRDIERRDKW